MALVGAAVVAACTSPPPTPAAPTPTSAPIVFATPAPTPTLVRPGQESPTPGPTSVGQAVRPPTATRASAAVATAISSRGSPSAAVYVVNTDRQGVTVRQTPGGAPMGVIPEGTAVSLTGEEQRVDGRLWKQVKTSNDSLGWVAAEFLSGGTTSSAVATATYPPLPTLRVPLDVIPTATHGVAEPTATRTPLPARSPLVPGRATAGTVAPLFPSGPSIIFTPTPASQP